MPTPYARKAIKPLNSYERHLASNGPTFSRTAVCGGPEVGDLYKHLRTIVPYRTSLYHRTIQDTHRSMPGFMESIGFQRAPGWSSWSFFRPCQVMPDIFAADYLAWSQQPFPGASWRVCINTDVGPLTLHVGDVVSMTLEHRHGGDESAMLDAFLRD